MTAFSQCWPPWSGQLGAGPAAAQPALCKTVAETDTRLPSLSEQPCVSKSVRVGGRRPAGRWRASSSQPRLRRPSTPTGTAPPPVRLTDPSMDWSSPSKSIVTNCDSPDTGLLGFCVLVCLASLSLNLKSILSISDSLVLNQN